MAEQLNEHFNTNSQLHKRYEEAYQQEGAANKRANDALVKISQLEKQRQKDYKDYTMSMKQEMKRREEVRGLEDKLTKLRVERDDLRVRYSKMAGAKLNDNNAGIADLSGPNRAMKLSEKFGELYDNEWTDAFQELTTKEMKHEGVLNLMLVKLKQIADAQMSSLENVLLHPVQQVMSQIPGASKERPRVHSMHKRPLTDIRKYISGGVGVEVKQINKQ